MTTNSIFLDGVLRLLNNLHCVRAISRPQRLRFTRILTMLLGLSISTGMYAAPNVVVSIAPLHSLVSEVMKGVAEPELLLAGGQSPHTAQLTPSAYRQISNADVLVWIGPSFEFSLRKAVAQIKTRDHVISLLHDPDMHYLRSRESGVWSGGHDHQTHDEALDGSGIEAAESQHLDGLSTDPHLWLSTENAVQIVTLISRKLIEIDSENSGTYQDNAQQVIEKIRDLKQELRVTLAPVKDISYLVFHDAYHYFEHEFDLSPAGAVTLNPERKPGAKTVLLIKNLIDEQQVRCLFSEPQFEPRLLKRLAEETNIKTGVLDPVGANLKPGIGQWFLLIRAMRDSLLACMKQT